MSIYGSDFAGVEDLDPNLTVVEGPAAVAVAVARRFLTPAGGLFYDRNFGFDVRRLLNAPIRSIPELTFRLQAEARKDQRVEDADVRVVRAQEALYIGITLTLATGPFTFAIRVTKLSVELLKEGP